MSIRISKTVWVLVAIGVFLLIFIPLGMAYRNQVDEQDNLLGQLNTTRQASAKIPINELKAKEDSLKTQIVTLNDKVSTALTKLDKPTNDIIATDDLFDLAGATKVEIVQLTSAGTGKQNIENLNCTVLPLTMRIEGDVARIIDFILELSNTFTTGVVGSVDISVPTDNTTIGSAGVTFTINSYGGK